MKILLKNATYLDWQTLELTNTNIVVDSDRIALVDNSQIPQEELDTVDCTGKIVTKSFVVGHHHAYSALARGMGAPKQSPANFYEILKYVWWTLDKCLDRETVEYSGLVTAMACAKAGATFAIDHHASPLAVKGSLGTLAKAFNAVGVGHLLCYEVSDRDGGGVAQEGLDETDAYLSENQGLVGLHASFTLSDATLKKASELMLKHKSGVHIHVAEDLYDQEHCLKAHGTTAVERLNGFGMLSSPKSILVHCLHLSDRERELIAKSPCWVAQNTDSNLNNNVGFFRGTGLGKNVMLGTDGMHSDMLQSMKSACLAGQRLDPVSPAQAYGRLRNAHRYLASNGYSGDGDSNLVVLDYSSPTPFTSENAPGHLVYGIGSTHVCDVIACGKVIVRNRKLTGVDEEAVHRESRKLAKYLWERMAR